MANLFLNKNNENTFFFPEILENCESKNNKTFKDVDYDILFKFVHDISY